jgi:(E)-4-hydroxy-3-methylbut-2-enyl-diphosphate synthase
MGCPVNGPGEAKAADYGVAGASDGKVVLFAKGEPLGVFPESEALERLLDAMGK